MNDVDSMARFVQLLTATQSRLYAHLYTLLGGAEAARDVLQETNLVLWKKAAEYDLTRPFEPWAMSFARFQAMAWRKRQQRDRLVFDDELVALLDAECSPAAADAGGELLALEECLQALPEKQRALVARRYQQGEAVNHIAEQEGRPANAIAALLYRARQALAECIKTKLRAKEELS
ncbi:MAG: sigma-70 family RNA polymerase sigma factor [Pedosphaera sp.]|nr:sigma-70 family RNA polymerase sigma factor [Pedosphaera sp.]